MFLYMFGMDANSPDESADKLASLGISAVVCSPETRCIHAVRRAGMQARACVGAFSLEKGDALCVDVDGQPRAWFGSGCPCDPAPAPRRTDALRRLAETDGLSGIFIDGARFASPSSGEGTQSLFTCFCPHCREEMRRMGCDPDEIRKAVIAWRDGALSLLPKEWLLFREEIVRRRMEEFVDTVRSVNPSLLTGAFVFPASLGGLVGQTSRSAASVDILAPMLYRRYAEAPGTATLNHEYNALIGLIGRERTRLLTGVDAPEDVLHEGFPPASLRSETIYTHPRLMPILQLDDDKLAESLSAVRSSGAEGAGFFVYQKELLQNLRGLNTF